MLQARTLPEARLYLDLMAADLGELSLDVQLAERAEGWSVVGDLGVQRLEVIVPFGRPAGGRFGDGPSELVDAAQWWLVATTSAGRVLTGEIAFDGSRKAWEAIVETWELAVAAAGEAVKLLDRVSGDPEQLPTEAIWSERGERLWRDRPEVFSRDGLIHQQAGYLGALAAFRRVHPRPES